MPSSTATEVSSRPPDSDAIRSAFPWRYRIPLFVGSALNPINSSLIATALVPIAAGLHISVGRTASLVAALYLASAIAQPTAGKVADVLGPRRVFLAGIGLVAVGGLIGGIASSLGELIVGRVLIGVGTSCAYPTAMVLVRRRAADAGLDRPPGSILGGLQIAGVATASLGLPLGGILVQLAGWRSVFLINVPVAVVALVVTVIWVPSDGPITRTSPRELAVRLDLVGVVLFAAAMTTLLGFLFSLPTPTWWLLGLTCALWLIDGGWELRTRFPFLDLRLLTRRPALSRTYLRFGLVFLCSYLVLYGITQWVQADKGYSAAAAGFLLLPMTVVSGLVVPPIARRNLVRGPLISAAVACLLAGALTLALPTPTWLVWIIVVTLLVGVATGTASSNSIALYRQADAEQLGTASGLMRSAGYLGSIASSAVTALVFRDHVSSAGVEVIAVVMLAAGIVLLLLTTLDRALRPVPPSEPASSTNPRTDQEDRP